MMNSMSRVAVLASSILLLSNCAGNELVDTAISDPSHLYMSLQANHKAILLSVYAPYDTVQLAATPRNVYGEALPYTDSVRFRPLNELDTTIHVNARGFVQAHSVTNSARVELSLTVDGVTRADTVTIMVRQDNPIRKIARVEFFPAPPDSNWWWSGINPAKKPNYAAWVRTYDENDVLIPATQRVVAFREGDQDVLIQGRSSIPFEFLSDYGHVGETWIWTNVYAYGREFRDSVQFRRVEPTAKYVAVQSVVPVNGARSMVFSPSSIQIRQGGTIIFLNLVETGDETLCDKGFYFCWGHRLHYTEISGARLAWIDSVDVIFDHPDAVTAGKSYGKLAFSDQTLASVPMTSDGGTGNIAAFGYRRCDVIVAPNVACGGPSAAILDLGIRSRKFDVAGTYHYSSSRYPSAQGTIIVTE